MKRTNKMTQKPLGLTLRKLETDRDYVSVQRQRDFKEYLKTEPQPRSVYRGKLFADLLKRQARRAMADFTECPPDTIPAHLARLDDIRDILRHVIAHDFAETPESRLSGKQLFYACTLADFLACVDYSRKEHRAPSFLNSRDTEISEINHKLDMLAGLFAGSRALNAVLAEDSQASAEMEREVNA